MRGEGFLFGRLSLLGVCGVGLSLHGLESPWRIYININAYFAPCHTLSMIIIR